MTEEYTEPVTKYEMTGDLENCKRAYMNKQYDTFITELKSGKFKTFEGNYKYNSDYDSCSEFVIRNRVSGMAQMFDKNRKYYFAAIKCYEKDGKYSVKSYWILNTELKTVLGSDYDDYEWKEIDLNTNLEDFLKNFNEETFASKYIH